MNFHNEIPIDHIEGIFILRSTTSKEWLKDVASNFQLRCINSMASNQAIRTIVWLTLAMDV